MQKSHVPESSGASLEKKPYLNPRTKSNQGGTKSSRGVFISSTESKKKGSQGGWPS